jgi:hypothetical protein
MVSSEALSVKNGRWQMTEDRYISKIVDAWVKENCLTTFLPHDFPVPGMFSSLGEKAKKYPRQLPARGYFRIKKEEQLTAA